MFADGTNAGAFGAVNLLGPRTTLQRPFHKFWNDQFTIVQLKYEFLTETSPNSYTATGNYRYGLQPIDLERIYFSFWDADTGISQVQGAVPAVEAMQMGPQIAWAYRGRRRDDFTTEIISSSTWAETAVFGIAFAVVPLDVLITFAIFPDQPC